MYLVVDGYCDICEQPTTFSSEYDWLRDHFKCARCGSIPRERAIMACLKQFMPDWHKRRIYECSPGGRGVSVRLAREAPAYVGSQYYPGLPLGALGPHGYQNQDLEKLTFPDASFDLVVTQDVMEHVFDLQPAFSEIARVLSPDGLHVFTTPLVRKQQHSIRRARRDSTGGVIHYAPPEYHGNPVDPSGSLVTFHWGYDITHYIYQASGLASTIMLVEDLSRGLKAEYNEVIVSSRSPAGENGDVPSSQ